MLSDEFEALVSAVRNVIYSSVHVRYMILFAENPTEHMVDELSARGIDLVQVSERIYHSSATYNVAGICRHLNTVIPLDSYLISEINPRNFAEIEFSRRCEP